MRDISDIRNSILLIACRVDQGKGTEQTPSLGTDPVPGHTPEPRLGIQGPGVKLGVVSTPSLGIRRNPSLGVRSKPRGSGYANPEPRARAPEYA